MKLIEQKVEEIKQEGYTWSDINRHVEKCGRTCYKSEDKITENSADTFVDGLLKHRHTAMLEHGSVYLQIPLLNNNFNKGFSYVFMENPYSRCSYVHADSTMYVSTNYRVLRSLNKEISEEWMCEPTKYHTKRRTMKIICDRGIMAEFTRHRVFSFAIESTRYCNYSRDKFGKEITYIKPSWLPDNNNDPVRIAFEESLCKGEQSYFKLIEEGCAPEYARNVLPMALKTEMIMTGFIDDWDYLLDLRLHNTTGKAHPQAQEIAKMIQDLL